MQRIGNLALRALIIELRIYESLWRAIARRPLIPRNAVGFRYHRPVLTVLTILIAVSAIEIPIIDAIVHRWLPVRIFFLILGIWGVTWMIGLLCAFFTRPHVVGPEGISVREGLELNLAISWEDIASLAIREHRSTRVTGEEKPLRVFDEDGMRVMSIRVSGETNLELTFERPLELRLPGLPPEGGTHSCEVLRFWADDPQAFLAETRRHIGRASNAQ
jgi:hypothetical protein